MTNLPEDWERWKNKVNNMLRFEADHNEKIEQLTAEDDLTGKQLWQRVKRMAGWSVSLAPTKFISETGLIANPKDMADILNNFFCTKIEKICNELEARTQIDPLALLRNNFNKWSQKNTIETF